MTTAEHIALMAQVTPSELEKIFWSSCRMSKDREIKSEEVPPEEWGRCEGNVHILMGNAGCERREETHIYHDGSRAKWKTMIDYWGDTLRVEGLL